MDGELQQNPDGVQPLPEGADGTTGLGVPEEVKKVSLITDEIKEQMVSLWYVFELQNQNAVPISELRVIMRALDFDLNPEQLELTRQQIDPTNEGIIRFAMLEKVMEDKLKDVDTYDDMILEFKKLDKDKDGKIPAPEFK